MNKAYQSVFYMIAHPERAVKITNLYRFLKGRYRLTTILAHSYKESVYSKIEKSKKDSYDTSKESNTEKHLQAILSMHDGVLHSGGLTDRLKGICTLYMFAKKQNLAFKIYFVFPFNLEKYLVPNFYDWSIKSNDISYNLNKTALFTWENEKSAHHFFHQNKKKTQLHIGCNSDECVVQYAELFHELFKPSIFLADQIKLHTENLGGDRNYVSISFRFQNLLGEFKEWNSTALNVEYRKLLIEKCLSKINEIMDQHKNIKKILITSDSNVFREIVTNIFPYAYTYIVPEEIGHIDYAGPGKGKELTAFLDMFLIAGAKKAYQIRTTEMYNSDFPKMAAKINDVPYEMILINE